MQTYAFLNQKGGTGKTTGTIHFARHLIAQGKRVIVVDGDAQSSSRNWCKRLNPPIPCEAIQHPNDLYDQVLELKREFDVIVIDSPGSLNEVALAILELVEMLFVPCQPYMLDVEATRQTLALLFRARRTRGGLPHAFIYLSKTDPRSTRALEDAKTALSATVTAALANRRIQGEDLGPVPVMGSVIYHRQIIADSVQYGSTVFDIEQDEKVGAQTREIAAKAAGNYTDLFKEVQHWLDQPERLAQV